MALLSAVLLLTGVSLAPVMADSHPLALTALFGVVVLFLVAGLIAWRLRPHNRIGMLMLLTGVSLWVSGLADTSMPPLSTLGIVTQTLPLALTVHLLLAYPSGRVSGRLPRAVVVAAYLACTVMQAPLYLVGEGPLAVTRQSSGEFVMAAAVAQTGVGLLTMVASAVIVAVAAARADQVARRQLGPLVWYRVLAPLLIAGAVLLMQISSVPGAAVVFVSVEMVAIAGLPVAFLFGLLSGSFGREGDVKEMVEQFGRVTPTASQLSGAVAKALGDPRAEVLYRRRDAGGYLDACGRAVPVTGPPGPRRARPVTFNGRDVGAIVYDQTLLADDSALDVLAGIVAMAIDQQRLDAEQRATLSDLCRTADALRQSRLRLLQAADGERRRIARDLHDGAQANIVLLGMTARQLSRRAGDPGIALTAERIADGLVGLLTEFRQLVSGIMPSPLIERGLSAAVRDLAKRMPFPTLVTTTGLAQQLVPEVETTAYYVVSEALTNAIKHADASSADVSLQHLESRLAVSVTDNGCGGAQMFSHSGLEGLSDRVCTLGGTFDIDSVLGQGTAVRAVIPCS